MMGKFQEQSTLRINVNIEWTINVNDRLLELLFSLIVLSARHC